MPEKGFRTGLLIGGLATAVVGLAIALFLTVDDEDKTTPEKTVVVKAAESNRQAAASSDPPESWRADESGKQIAFTAPSGNLICLMTESSVECAANEYEYAPPPQPDSCQIPGWGHVVGVDRIGAGDFLCADNAPADPNSPALPYGKGVFVEPFVCLSSEAGIRCANRDTKHGFQIAREQVELF